MNPLIAALGAVLGKVSWKVWVGLVVVLGLTGAGIYAYNRVKTAEAVVAARDLSDQNAIALRDSTIRVLHDSVAVATRQATQMQYAKDSAYAKVGEVETENSELRFAFGEVTKTGRVAVRDSATDSLRHITYRDSTAAAVVAFAADVPKPPSTASVSYGVQINPISVGIDLTCAAKDSLNVRPVMVHVTTPSWVNVTVAQANQSPDVCNKDIAPAVPKPGRFHLFAGPEYSVNYHVWGANVFGSAALVGKLSAVVNLDVFPMSKPAFLLTPGVSWRFF